MGRSILLSIALMAASARPFLNDCLVVPF